MKCCFTSLVLVVFAVIGAPSPALADVQQAALTRAVAAKEAALDTPEPARWQEAYDRFLEVDAVEPSADVKYELGFAAEQLKQDDLAVQHYEQAVMLGLNEPGLGKAHGFVARVGPGMARLSVRGRYGSRLYIRGILRGTLPLEAPVVVFPGETRIDVIEPGRQQPLAYGLQVEPGQTATLDLSVGANATASPATPTEAQPASRASAVPASLVLAQGRATWTETPFSQNASGVLLGVGLGLVVANGLLLPMSYWKLAHKRSQLADACDVPSGTPDGCLHAKAGQYTNAMELADDIAHWKTMRAFNWAGLGVGVVASSAAYLLFSRKHVRETPILALGAVDGGRALLLGWSSRF